MFASVRLSSLAAAAPCMGVELEFLVQEPGQPVLVAVRSNA